MRYFVRRLIDNDVDLMPVMNGPYGYESHEEAYEDLKALVDEHEEAYKHDLVMDFYYIEDFYIESESVSLPYNAPD